MSRLIVKVKYHKPGSKKSVAGYAEYIATREGVEIRDQETSCPPDTTYADYIATRPGVETRGSHGLFSIEDRPISLSEVSDELKAYKGNVYTVVLSLKKADADKFGFDSSEAWRELITEKADEISKCFNIPISELNCYAAFHKSDEHPHMHLMVWSKNPSVYPGYHKPSSLYQLKSAFARKIFEDELSEIYKDKNLYRDELREACISRIYELAEQITCNKNTSSDVIRKFIGLSERMASVEGKKVYGYLPQDAKDMVDDLLKDIASDPRFVELYEKWYELKEHQTAIYNSNAKERVPIEKNDEFKPIKNAIVKAAANLKYPNEMSSQIAVDDIVDLLCQIYVNQADEAELDDQTITESQNEVDNALGIKHRGG